MQKIRFGPKEVLITKYMQNQDRTEKPQNLKRDGRGSFKDLDHRIFDGAGRELELGQSSDFQHCKNSKRNLTPQE